MERCSQHGARGHLPQLSVAAMGQYAGAQNSSSSVPGASSTGGTGHGTTSALSLQWLLFDFGGRAARVEAASQASVVANIGFTAVHQQVIFDVSIAFYGYQAARARVATTGQGLGNAAAILAAAQSRYRHSIGTVIEVAQANQNRAQAKLALIQAQGAESNSYLAGADLRNGYLAALETHDRGDCRHTRCRRRRAT